jgi:transposase
METKLTKEQVIGILILRKNKKMTNRQIAEHYGVHYQTISYWLTRLKKEGYKIPKAVYKGGRPKLKI